MKAECGARDGIEQKAVGGVFKGFHWFSLLDLLTNLLSFSNEAPFLSSPHRADLAGLSANFFRRKVP